MRLRNAWPSISANRFTIPYDLRSNGVSRCSLLAGIGRKIFGWRLAVGLVIAAAGIELLSPVPFFAPGYRVVQSAAILLAFAGLALRMWGSGCAGRHTRTAQIEAPQLVTHGPFAYMRNP